MGKSTVGKNSRTPLFFGLGLGLTAVGTFLLWRWFQQQKPKQSQPATLATPDPQYSYYQQILRHYPLPVAYVDMDLLDENSQQVLRRTGHKKIRLATKSIRSVAILRHLLSRDSRFQGLMCYTAAEALYLAQRGFDDLLVAYPTWNGEEITAVFQANQQGHHITLMADSMSHLRRYSQLAQAVGGTHPLPVALDIDMSEDYPGLHFGVWRSTVRTPDHALVLAQAIRQDPYLTLDGVMGYEAQIAGVADDVPGQDGQNRLIRWLQQRSVQTVQARRTAVVHALRAQGHQLRFVNGGGTGSLASTSQDTAVTELTAGSAFYAPTLFDQYHDFRYRPAAGFALQIVRRPHKHIYTCLGGGYIASGAISPHKAPQPYLPTGATLTPLEGAGEVQTPVFYDGALDLQLGDPIFFRHAKAGELCEHFDTLRLIKQGHVIGEVETYRGDGQTFV
jgi:D-serine deaminase-like pyridoxal phosphate-dependent protein